MHLCDSRRGPEVRVMHEGPHGKALPRKCVSCSCIAKDALFEEPGVASKGLDHRQRQHGVGLHLLPLAEAALRLLVPLCQDLLKGLARACVGG